MDGKACAIAARTTVSPGSRMFPSQQLFQEQLAVNWTERLQPFAQRLNPLHEEIFRNYPRNTTGLVSNVNGPPTSCSVQHAHRLAPLLLEHGMLSFSSPDVLKFLGHRINVSGQIPGNYEGN